MSGFRNNEGRIYVGNLPPDIRTKDIEDLFYKFGKIVFIDLKNRRGPPFAFVEFEDPRLVSLDQFVNPLFVKHSPIGCTGIVDAGLCRIGSAGFTITNFCSEFAKKYGTKHHQIYFCFTLAQFSRVWRNSVECLDLESTLSFHRDADDAVSARDGYNYDGYHLRVEFPRGGGPGGPPPMRAGPGMGVAGGGWGGAPRGRGGGGMRGGPPSRRSDYRALVSGETGFIVENFAKVLKDGSLLHDRASMCLLFHMPRCLSTDFRFTTKWELAGPERSHAGSRGRVLC